MQKRPSLCPRVIPPVCKITTSPCSRPPLGECCLAWTRQNRVPLPPHPGRVGGGVAQRKSGYLEQSSACSPLSCGSRHRGPALSILYLTCVPFTSPTLFAPHGQVVSPSPGAQAKTSNGLHLLSQSPHFSLWPSMQTGAEWRTGTLECDWQGPWSLPPPPCMHQQSCRTQRGVLVNP